MEEEKILTGEGIKKFASDNKVQMLSDDAGEAIAVLERDEKILGAAKDNRD